MSKGRGVRDEMWLESGGAREGRWGEKEGMRGKRRKGR